jgi:hypothetical protein
MKLKGLQHMALRSQSDNIAFLIGRFSAVVGTMNSLKSDYRSQ